MADITLTATTSKRLEISRSFLSIQGEQITVDVVVDSTLAAMGYDAYVDFLLPDGLAYFKGAYDCSSETFSFTLGATDNILDKDGDIFIQLVLAETSGSARTIKWASMQIKTIIHPSILATTAVVLPYVPESVFPSTFPAANVSIVDVGDYFPPTNVEDTLQSVGLWIDNLNWEVGSQNYTEENYVTSDEDLSESIDKLDIAMADKINLAGGSTNPFTAMPYVGTAPIVESGSNANGSYTKWADGTMICYHTMDTGSAVSTSVGALFSSGSTDWTFPVAFHAAPVFVAMEKAGIGSCWGALGMAAATTTTASFKAFSAVTAAIAATMSLIAIGRWKA